MSARLTVIDGGGARPAAPPSRVLVNPSTRPRIWGLLNAPPAMVVKPIDADAWTASFWHRQPVWIVLTPRVSPFDNGWWVARMVFLLPEVAFATTALHASMLTQLRLQLPRNLRRTEPEAGDAAEIVEVWL